MRLRSRLTRLTVKEKFKEDYLYDYGSERKYDMKGHEETVYREGPTSVAEIRYSPWDFGLFFSLGYLDKRASEIEVEFDKRERRIGYNDYDTALDIEIDKEAWGGAAIGAGYNHVFSNGVSLGIGGMVGLTGQKRPDVTIKTDDGVTLSESDKNDLIEEIEDDEAYFEGYGFISVGYNF